MWRGIKEGFLSLVYFFFFIIFLLPMSLILEIVRGKK